MSFACSETHRNLQKDDDCFNIRLQEINHELQDILVKATQQREDRCELSCAAPLLQKVFKSDIQGIAGSAAVDVPVAFPLNLSNASAAARQIKQYTENQLLALLEPLIETKVHQMLQVFVGKIERTRDQQEETKASMAALSEECQEQRRVLQNTLSSFKHYTSKLQQLKTDFNIHEQGYREQMGIISDALSALNGKTQFSEQRTTRRIDELVRHHHETIRSSLTDMENHVQQWKGELEGVMHRQVSDWRTWSDELEAHVARLQGVLSSVSETINKHTIDLRDLMETVLEKRSEVRLCRRDIDRLEMLVHCGGNLLHTGADREVAAVANYCDSTQLTGQGKGSETGSMLLAQEISYTKEQANTLSNRIDELERCLEELDQGREGAQDSVDNSWIRRHRTTPRKLGNAETLSASSHHNFGAAHVLSQGPFRPCLKSTSNVGSHSGRRAKVGKAMMSGETPRFCLSEQRLNQKSTDSNKNSAFSPPQDHMQTSPTSLHGFAISHDKKQLTHFNVKQHNDHSQRQAPENPFQRAVSLEANGRDSHQSGQHVDNKIYQLQHSHVSPCQLPTSHMRSTLDKPSVQVLAHALPARQPSLQTLSQEGHLCEGEAKEDLNSSNIVNEQEDYSSFLMSAHKNASLQDYKLMSEKPRRSASDDVDAEGSDSYQSSAESVMYHQHMEKKIEDNEGFPSLRPDQYLPAPASDSESERINYKLSRLAID